MGATHDPASDQSAAQAARLLEIWDRLSRSHMTLGAGCSCGIGGVVVALEDFEQDIADYLLAEAERLERRDVIGYMAEHARVGDLWSISKLLVRLEQPRGAVDPEAGGFVLERLGRTLQSFEKLHGSR